MDIRRKESFAHIKAHGTKEPIIINDGMNMLTLTQHILQQLSKLPSRYDGEVTIRIGFKPFDAEGDDPVAREFAGLNDWAASLAEKETPEEEAESMRRESTSPYHVGGPNYDPLAHEYMMCLNRAHKARKSPEELMILRKHMEDNYEGTEWWDGTHRWMDSAE